MQKENASLSLHIFNTYRLTCQLLYELLLLQNEMLINEVYSTKWYELPPRYRKTIHIFQSQIQRPIHFFSFGMYPITMKTFAQSCRFVYSVINLLRRLNLKF